MPNIWSMWEWRWDILVPLLALGALYTMGWVRLRRLGSRKTAHAWRLVAYWAGWLCFFLALISPISPLSEWLLSIHMVQHMLLIMFGPPLIWLANPMPVSLWAFPPHLRKRLAEALFGPRSGFRRFLRLMTPRPVAWLAFIFIYVGWHDVRLYNLALRLPPFHDVQHITFTAAAMLYWWHVTNAGPRIHGRFSFASRLTYLLSVVPINMVTGLAITFGRHVYYTYYLSVPRYFGLSVMDDQRLAGMIMWIFGSMMLIYAALVFLARYIALEERKAQRAPHDWAAETDWRAPGLEHVVREGTQKPSS